MIMTLNIFIKYMYVFKSFNFKKASTFISICMMVNDGHSKREIIELRFYLNMDRFQ